MSHRPRSLRAKLTLGNVALLAIGILTATAASLMGMQHYLLANVDAQLLHSREALQRSELTMPQIDRLNVIAQVAAQALPTSETVLTPIGGDGQALAFAGVDPSDRQRALASAVRDPAALTGRAAPGDVTVSGAPYRVTATRLGDGTLLVIGTSTESLHAGLTKALHLDLAVGVGLLALLAAISLIESQRRLRPLKDMVETASAIADGDLSRRVSARCNEVSEVEQLRLALNAMLHQVETAFETREYAASQLRHFIADASHELRTPLAAIRGYLQLYDRGMLSDPADRTRALARMTAEAERMAHLVEELLTLARLDQRPVLRLQPVDLAGLVRDAAEDLRAQQPGRPVSVRLAARSGADGAPDRLGADWGHLPAVAGGSSGGPGPLPVVGDEAALRQVIGNLLANVRAHTPAEAAVSITLSREVTPAVGTPGPGEVYGEFYGGATATAPAPHACAQRAVLRIRDEGPGMSAEDAARIFDRFFRAPAESGPVGAVSGAGLGMAIVRGMVEAHEGSVTVETAPGDGLCVTVRLPVHDESDMSSSSSGSTSTGWTDQVRWSKPVSTLKE
jgi:two-component system OmpR family sensor kinase